MKKKLIIYGNGRMALIVHQFVKVKYDVTCFTVQRDLIQATTFNSMPLIPFEGIERLYNPKDYLMLIAVGYLQMNSVRRLKFIEAKAKGYTLATYVHPSVDLHDNVSIGEGNVVLDQVSLQPCVRLGNNNFLWSNVVIAHGCQIENDCWITSGVTVAGDTIVKSGCFLGINCSIGHRISLGEQTFVGASTLITKSTDSKSVYVSRGAEKHRLDSDRFLEFSGV